MLNVFIAGLVMGGITAFVVFATLHAIWRGTSNIETRRRGFGKTFEGFESAGS